MRVGTKSLLFGVHQVFIHPVFVAAGWIRLYGWPWHPLIWLAFLVHDWGYWGCRDMDGDEGERHPLVGGRIMWLAAELLSGQGQRWFGWTVLHSRTYAKLWNAVPSRLCYADKMAIVLTPWWVYLPLAWMSGELDEYMERGRDPKGKYSEEGQTSTSPREWHSQLRFYVREWIRSSALPSE